MPADGYENTPATEDQGTGLDHVIVELCELTTAILIHTDVVGIAGEFDQPAGGVPTLVRKFQVPPVGVAGCEPF